MPTMLLDRPIDQVRASNMPPGRPAPEGDEADSGHGTEDEEDEASPS